MSSIGNNSSSQDFLTRYQARRLCALSQTVGRPGRRAVPRDNVLEDRSRNPGNLFDDVDSRDIEWLRIARNHLVAGPGL